MTFAEEVEVWNGNESISWNTEVAPGTQLETPEGIFSNLAVGDIVRAYTTTTYESPQYVVTYKAGDDWSWTDLEISVSEGVLSFTVADETMATEISQRGLIFRGQCYNLTKITIEKTGGSEPLPVTYPIEIWTGEQVIDWSSNPSTWQTIGKDKFANVDFGQVDKYEKIVIETISRDDLEYWLNGVVQAILTTETSDCVLLPLNVPFSLRVGRFMKEGSYLPSGILGEKSVMICLSELIALKHGDSDFTKILKEGVGTQAPAKTLVKQEAPIDKHKTVPGEAIVDLHIGELVDNILGMSSHDMFKIQTDYFKKMLDSAIAAEYNKVTFIHGVGNGVLKNAIIEALKDYKNTENRMASIAKFGVGAIDVIITEKAH